MSFAHYDEIAEICCGMAQEEEVLDEIVPMRDLLDQVKEYLDNPNPWWREAVTKQLQKAENEKANETEKARESVFV